MTDDSRELEEKALAIHQKSVVVEGHCHLMKELMTRREMGEKELFKTYYAPIFRKVGVQVALLIIGGDNNSMVKGSDLLLWGALHVIDQVYEELAECSESVQLCLKGADIDEKRDRQALGNRPDLFD